MRYESKLHTLGPNLQNFPTILREDYDIRKLVVRPHKTFTTNFTELEKEVTLSFSTTTKEKENDS